MAAAVARFRSVGCNILVVTQAKPDVLRLFLDRNPQPYPVVGDPERGAYRAFGLERTSWLTFFKPRVLWGYVRLMLRGEKVRKPYDGEDVRQLGGDFILDRQGRTVWSFASADPTERPSIAELQGVLESHHTTA